MNVWCGAAVNTLGSCSGHFFGADRIIVSPDEGRTGSNLTPEVSGDHLYRATAVGAISQSTSLCKIKAIIRVVIIVLVNTVPENEMLCESWICPFAVCCTAVWPSFCENSERTVHACGFRLVSALHLFSLCLKKVEGLRGVGYFSLTGVTLSISVAVGFLTDCAVGLCLAGKKMLWFSVAYLLIIKWQGRTTCKLPISASRFNTAFLFSLPEWLCVSKPCNPERCCCVIGINKLSLLIFTSLGLWNCSHFICLRTWI